MFVQAQRNVRPRKLPIAKGVRTSIAFSLCSSKLRLNSSPKFDRHGHLAGMRALTQVTSSFSVASLSTWLKRETTFKHRMAIWMLDSGLSMPTVPKAIFCSDLFSVLFTRMRLDAVLPIRVPGRCSVKPGKMTTSKAAQYMSCAACPIIRSFRTPRANSQDWRHGWKG